MPKQEEDEIGKVVLAPPSGTDNNTNSEGQRTIAAGGGGAHSTNLGSSNGSYEETGDPPGVLPTPPSTTSVPPSTAGGGGKDGDRGSHSRWGGPRTLLPTRPPLPSTEQQYTETPSNPLLHHTSIGAPSGRHQQKPRKDDGDAPPSTFGSLPAHAITCKPEEGREPPDHNSNEANVTASSSCQPLLPTTTSSKQQTIGPYHVGFGCSNSTRVKPELPQQYVCSSDDGRPLQQQQQHHQEQRLVDGILTLMS